jgi:quercetin dioxygenase-like cupin family protein
MRIWNLSDHEVESQKPQVLHTTEEGRAVLIRLSPGDTLPEHHVRERATLIVISGRIEITDESGGSVTGSAGTMALFEPSEWHTVEALEDCRFLLLLAPWSLEKHSSLDPWSRDPD